MFTVPGCGGIPAEETEGVVSAALVLGVRRAESRGAVSAPDGSGTLSCGAAPGAAGRLAAEMRGSGPIGRVPGETIPPAVLPVAPAVLLPVEEGVPVPAPNVGGDAAPIVVLVSVPTGGMGPVPGAAALAVADDVGSKTVADAPVGTFVLMRFGLWLAGAVAVPAGVRLELGVPVLTPAGLDTGAVAPAVCPWQGATTLATQRPARIKAFLAFMKTFRWMVLLWRRNSAAIHGATLPPRTDPVKRHLFRRGNLPEWQPVHA